MLILNKSNYYNLLQKKNNSEPKHIQIKNNINQKIKILKKKIILFEKKAIHSTTNINYSNIIKIEKEILNLFFVINEKKLEYNINFENELNKLNEMNDTLQIIHKLKSYIMDSETNRITNILTITNLIFFPLNIIVGYFGMNFYSMGSPATKYGIFSIKYSHLFIILLFLLSVFIFFMITLYIFPNMKNLLLLKENEENNILEIKK